MVFSGGCSAEVDDLPIPLPGNLWIWVQLVTEKHQGASACGCLWEEGVSGSWVVLWSFLLQVLGDRILGRCNKTSSSFTAVEFPRVGVCACVSSPSPFFKKKLTVELGSTWCVGLLEFNSNGFSLTNSSLRPKPPKNAQHRLSSFHSMPWFDSASDSGLTLLLLKGKEWQLGERYQRLTMLDLYTLLVSDPHIVEHMGFPVFALWFALLLSTFSGCLVIETSLVHLWNSCQVLACFLSVLPLQ